METKWFVQLIESERGWGQRVDDTLEFNYFEEAKNYQNKFNSQNKKLPNGIVPDWYMCATDPFQK
jgi:hypothetical protein